MLFTKIIRNNTIMTIMTPSLVAMALSAAQNTNQQMKGANKRGDGVEAMGMAMATEMANGGCKGNCYGNGNGNNNGNGNTIINKQRG